MRRLLLSLLTIIGVGGAFAAAPAASLAMNPASFAAPTTTMVPGSSGALSGTMTTADFSQDGHADVAVYDGNWQTSAQSLAVWSSTTGGGSTNWSWSTLTPPPSTSVHGEAVAAANMNPGTDSNPDLIALGESAMSGGSVLAVYLGNGDGTFQAQIDTTLPGYAEGLTVADVNGDGIPDVLIPTLVNNGSEWEAEVVTLIGKGDGHFEAPIVSPVDSSTSEADVIATGIAVGQFTGGGSPDIAVSQAFSPPNDVYVLKGDGTGAFIDPTPMSLGVGSFGLAAGDFNGDGKDDFALPVGVPGSGGTVAGERIVTALGHDDGTFTALAPAQPEWASEHNPYSYTIHAADLNGDGLPDLLLPVASDSGEGGVWALLSDGDGSFSGGVTGLEGDGVWDVGAGDFNGDGRPDIAALVAHPGAELELAVYDNTSEPALALGGSALDLGGTTLGQTTTRQVTITDSGNYGLSISSLSLGGANAADFKATGCTAAPISPGASCDIDVTFTPSTAAAESATLTIASDAPSQPTATVALSGTGTKPGEAGGGSGNGSGPGGKGSGSGSGATATGTLKLARTASVSAKGQAALKLTCNGADCAGRLTLTASAKKKVKGKTKIRPVKLGSVRYSVGRGITKTVTLKLSAAGLRALDAAPGRRLAAKAAIAPDGGSASTVKLMLTGARPAR